MVSLPSFMHPESMNIGKNRIPVIMAKGLIRFDIGCMMINKSVFKDTIFFQFNSFLLCFFIFLLITLLPIRVNFLVSRNGVARLIKGMWSGLGAAHHVVYWALQGIGKLVAGFIGVECVALG